MSPQTRFRLPFASAAAIALALAAGACKPVPAGPYDATAGDGAPSLAQAPALPETLPLISDAQAGGAPTPIRYAPTAAELPRAEPLDYGVPAQGYDDGGGAGYGFIEQALSLASAFGDAPPDYAYGYDDSDPWAWQANDDSLYFAEPIDGGYRSYYYSAGSAAPYLVRDPYNSYGYDDGRLVAVYDNYGRLVPVSGWSSRRDYASRYYARGGELYRASRQRERRAVLASRWGERRPALIDDRRRWEQTRARDARWQRYHGRVADRQQAYWRDERQLRRAEAQRFDTWRQRGFEGGRPRLERVAQRADVRPNRLIQQRAQAERDRSIARSEQRRQRAVVQRERRDDRQQFVVRQDRQTDRQQQRAERLQQRAQQRQQRVERQGGDRQQQAQRQQRQAERQQQRAERQQQRAQGKRRQQQQAQRQQGRQQQQADRQRDRAQGAVQSQRQQARQQQRGQRQQGEAQRQQRQQQQAQRQQQRAERQARAQADRGRAEAGQRQRAERQQAGRQQTRQQQAENGQRQQRQAQQQQRQAERQQSAQRQQQQAQRQQAGSAERQQQQAQRQQQSAQRQQSQQAWSAERQQQRQARVAQRPDRAESRGDRRER